MVVPLPHWRLTLATVFHSFIGYSIFFDKRILNPLEIFVKEFANQSILAHYSVTISEQAIEWIWAGTSTSQTIGALIGCAMIKYLAEKFGRRNSVMIVKNVIIITSSSLQFLGQPLNSIELFILGRIIGGLAYAQAYLIPIFLAECSPTEFRGLVSSAPGLGSNIWCLIGALSPVLIAVNSTTWNYLLLCPAVPALVHLLATPSFPKSVKHLYITKKDLVATRRSTRFYHGRKVNSEQLHQEMDNEADICPTVKVVSIKIMLAAKQFRKPTILCLVAGLMMTIGGGMLIGHYSTGILLLAGIPPSSASFYNALFIHIPISVLSLLGVALVERLGRRAFLLTGITLSTIGMGVLSLSQLSVVISDSLPPIVTVGGLSLIVLGLSIGPYLICPIFFLVNWSPKLVDR